MAKFVGTKTDNRKPGSIGRTMHGKTGITIAPIARGPRAPMQVTMQMTPKNERAMKMDRMMKDMGGGPITG